MVLLVSECIVLDVMDVALLVKRHPSAVVFCLLQALETQDAR
jgi:hypothetical protein